MADIVERLKQLHAEIVADDGSESEQMTMTREAADEIERLLSVCKDKTFLLQDAYARSDRRDAEIERLRAALQRVRNGLHAHNRPDQPLSNEARIRLRDLADLALEQSATECPWCKTVHAGSCERLISGGQSD